MGRWWSGSLYRHPGSVGHVWPTSLWIITEHLRWTILLRHEICGWMFTGTLINSSGHIQWWVNMALGIWELLSGRLEVPLKKVNVKYLRLIVWAGTQCLFYKECPVQSHPQGPDTMLCFWVIVLMYYGLLAFWLYSLFHQFPVILLYNYYVSSQCPSMTQLDSR